MDFRDKQSVLDLDNIRAALIRMEDTIVFNLIERAQFCLSQSIYEPGKIPIPGFDGSFLDYVLLQTEILHSKVRRYESPDEMAFFAEQLPPAILEPLNYPEILALYHREINVNDEIKQFYTQHIVTQVATNNQDDLQNYGSCSLCDIDVLQALSRRIHFGKFVAESKFQAETAKFTALIKSQDAKGIDEAITNMAVELKVLERIGNKAEEYSAPLLRYSQKSQGSISRAVIYKIYKDCVIPLTKKVEVEYLLRRLDG